MVRRLSEFYGQPRVDPGDTLLIDKTTLRLDPFINKPGLRIVFLGGFVIAGQPAPSQFKTSPFVDFALNLVGCHGAEVIGAEIESQAGAILGVFDSNGVEVRGLMGRVVNGQKMRGSALVADLGTSGTRWIDCRISGKSTKPDVRGFWFGNDGNLGERSHNVYAADCVVEDTTHTGFGLGCRGFAGRNLLARRVGGSGFALADDASGKSRYLVDCEADTCGYSGFQGDLVDGFVDDVELIRPVARNCTVAAVYAHRVRNLRIIDPYLRDCGKEATACSGINVIGGSSVFVRGGSIAGCSGGLHVIAARPDEHAHCLAEAEDLIVHATAKWTAFAARGLAVDGHAAPKATLKLTRCKGPGIYKDGNHELIQDAASQRDCGPLESR